MVNIYFITVVISIVLCVVYSDDTFLNETIHSRVKRGKYYSSSPQRFYRRPPMTYPVKGFFSYTPPPGYMEDEPQHPGYKPKVSKTPKEGLGDEDINNIVKYLSKHDLDKIIEFAGEKERIKDNTIERKPVKREESQYQENTEQHSQISRYKSENSNQKFNYNGYRSQESESQIPQSFKQNNNFVLNSEQQYPGYKSQDDQKFFAGPYAPNDELLNHVEDATQSKVIYINQNGYSNAPIAPSQSEEFTKNNQLSYLNIHHQINDPLETGSPNVFTDSQIMKEEELPTPVNLRDDFDISYTNKVASVVKPSYDVKNFGDLPLMSNDYKLDTVSSYKVPHYTVTSNSKYTAPSSSHSAYNHGASSSQHVPVEPAPSVTEAKEQSDAHLKATKIWTHRSKGTAYTLHNDGTLSLEKAGRPKTKYGP